LISVFGLPAKIQSQLPANPSAADTPATADWGWWMRTDRSEQIPALNKLEEIKEWVFAAWEIGIFNVIA
jgi:hypothetical protein